MLPPVLQVVENSIYVKVFTPSYIAIPTELKVGCIPILNVLRFDSK